MGERTEYAPGTFCWVELGTADPAEAKRFYADVFGWSSEDVPMGQGQAYTLLGVDGHVVAGLYGMTTTGQPPAWLSYVAADELEVRVDRAKELGATVLTGPLEVGPPGRLAVLADPLGAVFGLWEAGERPGASLVNEHGALTMTQLNSSHPEASQRFYEQLFLWQFEQLDTGAGPPYWSVLNDGTLNAGMMPLPDEASGAPSHWLAYFAYDELDAAPGRIADGGGEVVVPPTAVPAGRFLVARDPQGAHFAVFEGELDP